MGYARRGDGVGPDRVPRGVRSRHRMAARPYLGRSGIDVLGRRRTPDLVAQRRSPVRRGHVRRRERNARARADAGRRSERSRHRGVVDGPTRGRGAGLHRRLRPGFGRARLWPFRVRGVRHRCARLLARRDEARDARLATASRPRARDRRCADPRSRYAARRRARSDCRQPQCRVVREGRQPIVDGARRVSGPRGVARLPRLGHRGPDAEVHGVVPEVDDGRDRHGRHRRRSPSAATKAISRCGISPKRRSSGPCR